MEYIVHRRFKDKTLSGDVNLPATTPLDCTFFIALRDDEIQSFGIISHNNKALSFDTSENAHQYFARNDDGQGMKRGELTHAIQTRLAKRDAHYQERWDKVWSDEICQRYKRIEYDDFWRWNHDFFNADISVLQYIAKLIGIKIS